MAAARQAEDRHARPQARPGSSKRLAWRAYKIASAPTTDGVIDTLQQEPLRDARVAVQLYNEARLPLIDYLAGVGATAFPVLPYIYAPGGDSERIAELIEKMADGAVDALVFTSSPQIDRLFRVAAELKRQDVLARGLQRVRIAAVGPLVKEKLLEKKARVDIMPEQGFVMKNLVQHIKRALERLTSVPLQSAARSERLRRACPGGATTRS